MIHPMSKLITIDDLLLLKSWLWPDDELWEKEVEMIEATLTSADTFVQSCNKVGKDYTAGFIVPACFLVAEAKGLTCRIVTSSVDKEHLGILWGEIGQRLRKSKMPMGHEEGGPLVLNDMFIRRASELHLGPNAYNYVIGQVYAKGEKMAGAHADFTLFVGDEASALGDDLYSGVQGWAHHRLWIGNPNPCHGSFYYNGCKAGDLAA